MSKINNIILKPILCAFAAVLSLSVVPIPAASAADNDYFYVDGSTLILDELGPDDDATVSITLRAAREMDLRNIRGNFTPISEDDEDLEVLDNWSISSHGMWMHCSWWETGEFEWNTEPCHSEYHGYEDDLHLQPGDPIFDITYDVKPGVQLMSRNLPVTIESATIVEGATPVSVGDIVMDADVYVYPSENFYTIRTEVEGNGAIEAPAFVLPGEDAEIHFVPDENNELLRVLVNYSYATDEVENNTLKISDVNEPIFIYAVFRPVFEVTEGDGSEYVVGSSEGLTFKINADLDRFHGEGLLDIDDDYLDMDTVEIDPDAGTITIPADYLSTLSLGEHSLSAFFSYLDSGIARAKFYVVEPHEEEDDEPTSDEPAVPSTGAFTTSQDQDGVNPFNFAPLISAAIILAFIIRKKLQKAE